MEINKVHCFFEQSGVFKEAFIKNNIDAYDYDIQNEYGKTDYVVDLFEDIEEYFFKNDNDNVFNDITSKDLIIAFFSLHLLLRK